MEGVICYIIQGGGVYGSLGAVQVLILREQLTKLGARVVEDKDLQCNNLTHIITNRSYEEMLKHMVKVLKIKNKLPENIKVVKLTWASSCIDTRSRAPDENFGIQPTISNPLPKPTLKTVVQSLPVSAAKNSINRTAFVTVEQRRESVAVLKRTLGIN